VAGSGAATLPFHVYAWSWRVRVTGVVGFVLLPGCDEDVERGGELNEKRGRFTLGLHQKPLLRRGF